MKEIKIQDKTYLFVEVPDGAITFAKNYRDSASFEGYVIQWNLTAFSDNHTKIREFKDFEIISTTKDISEKQAESIIGNIFCKCRYGSFMTLSHPCKKECKHPKTPKESLQSLIQANGLDINKNYLILKINGSN
jgi:hypothetical protein